MTSTANVAAEILRSAILDDALVLHRKLCCHATPAQTLSQHEQEQWELLDAVRERLLIVSVNRHRGTTQDAVAFSVCVQMLRNLISSRH